MGEVERGSAEVCDLNALVEGIHRLEKPHYIGPDAVVAEQNVPDAANQRLSHRIFATPILRPEASNAWQAHAIHGSNECTVRNTSNGSSGRASGVCSNDASYGPCAPDLSRGLAFHVEGTTA